MYPSEGIKRKRQKIKQQKSKQPIYKEAEMTRESDDQSKSGKVYQELKKQLLKIKESPSNSGDSSQLAGREWLFSQVSDIIVYDILYIIRLYFYTTGILFY